MSLIRDKHTVVVGKDEVLASVLDKDDHSIMGITFPAEKLKNKSINEISSMIKNTDELSNLKGAASLMFIDPPYNELGEIPVIWSRGLNKIPGWILSTIWVT